jgi:phage-related protein
VALSKRLEAIVGCCWKGVEEQSWESEVAEGERERGGAGVEMEAKVDVANLFALLMASENETQDVGRQRSCNGLIRAKTTAAEGTKKTKT